MVSAISLCLLAIGLSTVSSQSLQSDADYLETPQSDRRTFSHKKPVKVLPLFKKHKKFGGIVPHHIFSKAPSAEIIYQEAPKPIYKVHRYQGVELKPISDVSYSTPEPVIETHSIEPPTGDFAPTFDSDHSFPSTPGSSFLFYPEHDKPIFPSPPPLTPLPSPIKPIFSYVPAPPQPVFSSIPIQAPSIQIQSSPIPINSVPSPTFSSISIPRPAPIQPLPPVFASIPASFSSHSQQSVAAPLPPSPLPAIPPQPVFSAIPIKIQVPALPPVPAPTSVFSAVKIPAPAQPIVPAPAQPILSAPAQPILPAPAQPILPAPAQPILPAPAQPILPAPAQPILSAPAQPILSAPAQPILPAPAQSILPAPAQSILPAPSPAPVLPSISAVSPTPVPAIPSIPVSLPPVQFSVLPSPLPPLPSFQPPSIPATPEPEFPYPPSGTPIQSYVKDISLGDIEIKDSVLPTVEAPKYEEVTPTIADAGTKDLDISGTKSINGFFQKIKGWKGDKVNTALSFAHFKPKPPVFDPHPSKLPVELPPLQVPSYPAFQLPAPIQSLPLAPAPVFFPPSHFNPPPRYENFPPNNIESPPLLNSYGVPIRPDLYAPAHASHDRLSSAASEEQPSVVQAPAENQEKNLEIQQQLPQPQFQPQAVPHEHPVYVPEENKIVKDDKEATEDIQPEAAKEPNSQDEAPNTLKYPNHKE